MLAAPLPPDDAWRLQRLRAMEILDSPAEASLDGFTHLASQLTGMPIALVSLVDEKRQWFKSAVGLPQGSGTCREVSFCGHAIARDGLFEIGDGHHARRVPPRQIAAMTDNDTLQAFRARLVQLLKGHVDRMEMEHPMRSTQGEALWVVTRAKVTERDAAGRAVRIVDTTADATSRRRQQGSDSTFMVLPSLVPAGPLVAASASDAQDPAARCGVFSSRSTASPIADSRASSAW